jgi:hypothetical protein
VYSIPGLVTLCAVACHDSPSDPLASITTVETVPSLAISSYLPAVGELAARLPEHEVLQEALVEWEASWDREDGELIRSELRQEVAPVLYEVLGASSARSAVQALGWLRETPDLAEGLPPELGRAVARALDLLGQADEALEAGHGDVALGLALAASDAVRSVTPEAVARRLIGRGRTLMDSGAMALGDEQRARHLLNGAQRALDREDYTRAIQRAFYACQVMEGVREKPEPPYLDGSAEADSAGPAASGGEPIP